MLTVLTSDQLRAIDHAEEHIAEAVDPRDNRRYVIIPADEYDSLRDDHDQALIRRDSVRALVNRLQEDE